MNFLNSPGGVILRELGIGREQPDPLGGVAKIQEQSPDQLPYRKPKGFLNRLFQAMTMGGM